MIASRRPQRRNGFPAFSGRSGAGAAVAAIAGIHHRLTASYDALDRPQDVFVVAFLGTGACVLTLSVEEVQPTTWGRISGLSQEMAGLIGRIQHTYVFAYSRRAREAADRVRRMIRADGWSLVHADDTGFRIVADASTGRRIPEPTRRRALLGAPVRQQRYALLENARSLLEADPRAQLGQADLAAVTDALSDEAVAVRCLPWHEAAAVQLWRQAAGSSDLPARILARALLAGALSQQNDVPGAHTELRSAVEQAGRGPWDTTAPGPGHPDRRAPAEPHHGQRHVPLRPYIDRDGAPGHLQDGQEPHHQN